MNPNFLARAVSFKRSFALPPLVADNDLLIDFLAQDDKTDFSIESADRALAAGMEAFHGSQFPKAVAPLGIYYEICRKIPEKDLYLPSVAGALVQNAPASK